MTVKVDKKWIDPEMATDSELASESATRSAQDISHQSQISNNTVNIASLQTSKYDASNPNAYETPSQLNARDTANRSRANHSGTQLSNTISDFLTTVLASVLTGLSFATGSDLVSTDSVIIAFGKIQKMITDVRENVSANTSNIAAVISSFSATVRSTLMTGLSTATNSAVLATDSLIDAIGKLQAQIAYAISTQSTFDIGSNTSVSTASTTVWTTHTTLVTPALVSGNYRLFNQWAGLIASNGRAMEVRITRNGTTVFSTQSKVATTANDIAGFSKFIKFAGISGVQTFTFDFRTGASGASTVSVTSSDLALFQEGGV